MGEEKTKRYILVERQIKNLDEEKKTLRTPVIQWLKDGNGLKGITYSTRSQIKYYDQPFLSWLNRTLNPELYQKCIKQTVDLEQVEKLIETGYLQYDEIPEECYTVVTSDVLTVKKE